MEVLRSNLLRVRIPEPTSRVYKHECCVSFDTPKSEGGLFVDMNSFVAFGKEYVQWNFEKTGNAVYLHIKQTKKAVPEDRPFKKPTLLAIGIDGGFDSNEPEYEESYSVVVLPSYSKFSYPSVALPEQVRLSADAILQTESCEKKDQLLSWASEKKASVYAAELPQMKSGVIVPPSGWKCERCEMQENLWLNLSDGTILCARKNWDGTGGNNHAIDHYHETGFPLAVKLGTISSNLQAADVYSYPEDRSVIDPFLEQHLAFFGIDVSLLLKTELTTDERELDHNLNFDFNRIQENDQELEVVSGPGYTGLINLGNSCYMAATLQVIFATHSFSSQYYHNVSLKVAFEKAPSDPALDLEMQLTKLAHGLLSGKCLNTDSEAGIRPQMLKSVIASGHPEFSSTRQQDALEFFLHFLDQVERSCRGSSSLDPSKSFKFGVEDRIVCSSGKVAYNKRHDYILSLNIPLDAATNQDQLRISDNISSPTCATSEIVRPRIPLEACISSYLAPEKIDDFYSTALKRKTTATKTTLLTSFPDILVLHMRKFVMEEGWVPKKLDAYVEVPDVIDITSMRSKGGLPGEEFLPESDDVEVDQPIANEEIVAQLVSMGFNQVRCEKAAVVTSNAGVEEAMNWLLSHTDDPDIDDVDQSKLDTLLSFGFQEDISRKALKATNGDIESATDWILSNPGSGVDSTEAGATATRDGPMDLCDGGGRYKLFGIVSHMGTSTHCGHYVAHVWKDGRWVLFNDEKVAVSVNPPRDMGYLYFFSRVEG